ncbi:MAG TPA: YciI family protein [Phycisphaerales bacterium]|nr:YciI family protein [Phycisphaerales bacterium]
MRVMVIVKASRESEAGVMPSAELLQEMGKFNEELQKAGVMVDGAGLKPTSQGARVRFVGSDRSVIKGPFTGSKDLIAGYWLWKVGSLEEAIGWLKRCPHPHPGSDTEVEIRPLFEESDFA